MVESRDPSLDRIFHALSDPTRRSIVGMLTDRELTVTELAEPFRGVMSLAAASKHIRCLEDAGFIQRSIRGRIHVCKLNPAPLRVVDNWVEPYTKFWLDRLDALDRLLASNGDQEPDGDQE